MTYQERHHFTRAGASRLLLVARSTTTHLCRSELHSKTYKAYGGTEDMSGTPNSTAKKAKKAVADQIQKKAASILIDFYVLNCLNSLWFLHAFIQIDLKNLS